MFPLYLGVHVFLCTRVSCLTCAATFGHTHTHWFSSLQFGFLGWLKLPGVDLTPAAAPPHMKGLPALPDRRRLGWTEAAGVFTKSEQLIMSGR